MLNNFWIILYIHLILLNGLFLKDNQLTSFLDKDTYPIRKGIKGLQTDLYTPEEIIKNNVHGVAFNFPWTQYQPSKITICKSYQIKYDGYCYNESPVVFDQIKTYSEAGVVVTGIFYGPPEWARRSCENNLQEFCAPTDEATEDFGRFVGFIAWYFNGENGNGRVADFVIHNEVNSAEWFNYGCTPGTCDIKKWTTIYANNFNIAYDYIKKEQKEAKVLMSFDNFFGSSLDAHLHFDPPKMSVETFLTLVIPKIGEREWRVAFHAYPAGNTFGPDDYPFVTFGNIGILSGWLRLHYPNNPSSWEIQLTENGINCNKKEMQETQANLLCIAFKNVLGTPDIESFIYHRLMDHPLELELYGVALGLMEPDGTPKKSWKIFSSVNDGDSSSCGFEYLPYVELIRAFNTKGYHWVTTRQLPEGYKFEYSWKILRKKEEGTVLVFECKNVGNPGANTFISKDAFCEGQFSMGPMGYVYTSKKESTVALYRCLVESNGDHFISNDKKCEGQKTESLVGYVYN